MKNCHLDFWYCISISHLQFQTRGSIGSNCRSLDFEGHILANTIVLMHQPFTCWLSISSSADDFSNPLGPRSGPTERRSLIINVWHSGSVPEGTFEKKLICRQQNIMKKYPACKELYSWSPMCCAAPGSSMTLNWTKSWRKERLEIGEIDTWYLFYHQCSNGDPLAYIFEEKRVKLSNSTSKLSNIVPNYTSLF